MTVDSICFYVIRLNEQMLKDYIFICMDIELLMNKR